MKWLRQSVNVQIAVTHIITRKRQTLIAALGVTVGMSLFIFTDALIAGFTQFSRGEMFKTIPHIRIYRDDEISHSLVKDTAALYLISNPAIVTQTRRLYNANALMQHLQVFPFVKHVTPQLSVNVLYQNGKTEIAGQANGIIAHQANEMFNIAGTIVAGSIDALANNFNGIILGEEIAGNMGVSVGDYILVKSSDAVSKTLKVVGLFSVGNKGIDQTRSYINLAVAQQLEQKSHDYITDVYVSVNNPDASIEYAKRLRAITAYTVDDWQTANADLVASDNIRSVMNNAVAMAIMLVAAFGLYNILNMTITQKMNDIAILKATGFSGKDVMVIFLTEAAAMGVLGVVLGLALAAIMIEVVSHIYIGPPVGYFPIFFKYSSFVKGAVFGLLFALGAGYIPARRAGRIDPIEIFRR